MPARQDTALEKNWESKGDPKESHAAFGSQDLGFRTSIVGSQDLGFRTSINGHWVSAPRQTHARNKPSRVCKSGSAGRGPVGRTCTPELRHGRRAGLPGSSNGERGERTKESLGKGGGRVAGSADELKRGIVVSRTHRRT